MWLSLFRDAVQLFGAPAVITDYRDPKDNKSLDLVVDSKADALVSSDIHLLEIHVYRDIPILTLAHFRKNIQDATSGS